jgi:tetratricopeptide (TPR) repeat protein
MELNSSMRFNSLRRILFALSVFLLLSACSTQKNTWLSRHYNELNTRYNVYFNGNEAYKEGVKMLETSFVEDFSKPLLLNEVSDHVRAKATSGTMDKAIAKAQKAIKKHSIRVKPSKKPGLKAKPSAKVFYEQEEFNPFMDEVFLLMAKSQYTKTDFMSASATCSYIIRHFATNKKSCDEAAILQARSYIELGWYYEAENVLNDLNKDNLTTSLIPDFSISLADLYIRRKSYSEALPYLEIATRKAKKRRDKQRWTFVLGQLYQLCDRKEKAYKTFNSIPAMNPPYEMELNARIRQTEVFPSSDTHLAMKQLEKMSKSRKNKEYLEQVHYALSNLYLASKDTTNALKSLQKGLSESKSSGPQKLKTLLSLGNLYYATEQFNLAEPCYTQALSMVTKTDERYGYVSKQAALLKELAPIVKTIHDEDSLFAVARMPESERNKLIAERVKDAEKKAKIEAQKRRPTQEEPTNETNGIADKSENKRIQPPSEPTTLPEAKIWYFYNQTAVENGLRDFQRKWSNRPLIDDWRRLQKAAVVEHDAVPTDSTNLAETATPQPRDTSKTTHIEGTDDPLNPNFYLKDLPLTEEEQKASLQRLSESLYKAGFISWEQMENDKLAVKYFSRLAEQFPENPNLEKVWFTMYLMYKYKKEEIKAEQIRTLLLNTFPNGVFGIRLFDPMYIDKLKKMYQVQDSLYENTYAVYNRHQTDSLLQNVHYAEENITTETLQPKYQFLAAMENARTGNADPFHDRLVLIRDSFPKSDLQPLVKQMLAFWDQGKRPVPSAGYNLKYSELTEENANGQSLEDTISNAYQFLPKEPHYLLFVYDTTKVNVHRLQFDVALYNFSNYLVRDYELTAVEIGKMNVLLVSEFENAEDGIRYRSFLQFQGQVPEKKYPGMSILLVSETNLKLLEKGASPKLYTDFYQKYYSNYKPTF